MAGAIFISDEIRLPLSSQQLGYLTARIRAEFGSQDQAYLEEIYSPMDDEGMSFISCQNLDVAGCMVFFEAVTKAKNRAQSEDVSAVFGPLWDNLLAKIRLDPRFSSSDKTAD